MSISQLYELLDSSREVFPSDAHETKFPRRRPTAMFQGWRCLVVLDLERETELWFVLYLRRCYSPAMVMLLWKMLNSIHMPARWSYVGSLVIG